MQIVKKLKNGLGRLIRNQDGNALVVTATVVIPMLGMIGGGFDLARAHLAKSRLSQACDASALAGRRAMSGEDIETAKPEAIKFFNHNFPQNYLGTSSFTPTITRPDVGTVKVAATTSVPTTLMKVFNYSSIPISVDCDATQNFDNIDIVLVLDVTGSMDSSISGEKKIVSLRKAVMALYDELASAQTQLAAQGLRLRYAIVPYSSTVNVGKIVRSVNSNYIADEWVYQSRTRWWDDDRWRNRYEPKTVDVRSFVAGNSVNAATIVGGSNNWTTWNGCIEERATTSSITPSSGTSYSDIPSNAFDLDINRVPSADARTKWGPQWDQIVYQTDGDNVQNWCPAEAQRLRVTSRVEMQNYVNTLQPVGPTYHDIGMIWGARFISRGGIFSGDNPSVFNDRPVNRYVIFMTDGILEPSPTEGAAYGVEYLDQRIMGGARGTSVAGGNNQPLEKRHTVRFQMACNAAKQGGASIWTIAFGLSVPTSLRDCASNSDQVATSANSGELIAKFKEIGKNIGALRLSK